MAYYVLDENKNLVQSFDREGFLAILQQAIADQSLENIDEDSAVASKLRSNINGTAHHIEFVTAAQYSELETQGQLVAGTYYFIIDDTTEEDLENAIGELQTNVGTLQTNVGTLQTGVSGLNERVSTLEQDYENNFEPSSDPESPSAQGWDITRTDLTDSISSGFYLCLIKASTDMSDHNWAVVPLFVSATSNQDRSPTFRISINGTSTECILTTVGMSGGFKRLSVFRVDSGNDVTCVVYYHKVFGTA